MASRPTVGYWDLRGIGEPIRYILKYKKIDFEDKRYYSYEPWLEDKFSLGLDFPNLPYYVDGDVKITQSMAILRYLAYKHDLYGVTTEDKTRLHIVEQQLQDFRSSLISSLHDQTGQAAKAIQDHIKTVNQKFELFSNFLGGNKFLVGDSLTYVDFLAYDVFDYHWYLEPSIMNEFPNIKEYLQRIRSLPELREHFETQKRWPFLAPFAYFGGTGPEPKRD